MRTVLLLLCAALATGGCKNKRDPGASGSPSSKASVTAPKRADKPLEIEWHKDDEFRVKGRSERYGDVSIYEGNYQITIHGFPEKTRWAVGELKGEIDSAIYDIVKIEDITGRLGEVPIAKLRDHKIDIAKSMTLDLPNGDWIELKLPPADLGLSVERALEKVENGPVVFAGEPADAKPRENIMLLESFDKKVFGRATVLADIDGVAIVRRLEEVKGTKVCSGYTDNSGKPMPNLELQLLETEVVIYERRTGEVWAKKVFPPDSECPMFTLRAPGEDKQDSSKPTQKIEAWLRSEVKR